MGWFGRSELLGFRVLEQAGVVQRPPRGFEPEDFINKNITRLI